MKIKTNVIPDEIFFNEFLPDTAKMIYVYLMSTCDSSGVCHGQNSSAIEKALWIKLRAVQIHLKNLLDFKLITKVVDKDGVVVPRIYLDSKGNAKVPSSYKTESKLIPSRSFKTLLDTWNNLYETNVTYSTDLYKIYLDRCESIEEKNILEAAKRRFKSIKGSSEYKDPSKTYYRNSLKHFLRDNDSVDTWINADATGEDDLSSFNFY